MSISLASIRAFRLGLKDNGYIDGENVAMEYGWTENRPDQLTELARDLIRRRVAVIVTSGGPSSAAAAKAATTTIPVVFIVNEDPVKLGLVTSLARPTGNLTGVNIFLSELAAKRLELLRELLPAATRVTVLVNPVNAVITETTLKDVDAAARGLGLQIQVVRASTALEINSAFGILARERPDALFVTGDPFFLDRRVQLANLASHHSIPVASGVRGIAEAGWLISYGASLSDA